MSAVHLISIFCDEDDCEEAYGPFLGPTSFVRAAAIEYKGWSHPSFGTDLCPAHKAVAS